MQASTRYTALIIGLVVLTLGLTACGDSPTRAEFEALEQELTTANNRIDIVETAVGGKPSLNDRVDTNSLHQASTIRSLREVELLVDELGSKLSSVEQSLGRVNHTLYSPLSFGRNLTERVDRISKDASALRTKVDCLHDPFRYRSISCAFY